MEEDLQRCEQVAISAARKAGQAIKEAFFKEKKVHHKGKVDLVTETDKACEELIFNEIKSAFPTHEFIGEEGSSLAGVAELTDAPTWMVDPIDGTTNFIHGFPFVCVSIGLAVQKRVVVGVVHNPIIDEMFTAIRGKGAFLNGKQISVTQEDDIGNALMATEDPTARDKATVDDVTDRINRLFFKIRALRCCGSCALGLAGVACGRLDLFYEVNFGGPWDAAAGSLLVEEAGGLVYDPSGRQFDIMSMRVAASNGSETLKNAFVAALEAP